MSIRQEDGRRQDRFRLQRIPNVNPDPDNHTTVRVHTYTRHVSIICKWHTSQLRDIIDTYSASIFRHHAPRTKTKLQYQNNGVYEMLDKGTGVKNTYIGRCTQQENRSSRSRWGYDVDLHESQSLRGVSVVGCSACEDRIRVMIKCPE